MVNFTKKLLIANPKQNKSPTKVKMKYNDFADVFIFNLAIKLSNITRIYEYAIELVVRKLLVYSLVHNLSPIE